VVRSDALGAGAHVPGGGAILIFRFRIFRYYTALPKQERDRSAGDQGLLDSCYMHQLEKLLGIHSVSRWHIANI
jgi:hypothetical protein